MSLSEVWNTFHCENPDFVVRSVPDGASFEVNRVAMQNSEVFRDMFSFGETVTHSPDVDSEAVDIHETSGVLIALLRLLHYPPAPPVLLSTDEVAEQVAFNYKLPKRVYDATTVIPLPLLQSLLYTLVDKYAISDSVTKSLNVHLLAHAPAFPLQVYGFAAQHAFDYVACEASQYLLSLASYTTEEITANIRTVVDYHKVARLQALRVKALRDLVIGEDIFPHGYGVCSSHQRQTVAAWETRRMDLAPLIETATDVAGEMETVMVSQNCKLCQKAKTAAVQMLAVGTIIRSWSSEVSDSNQYKSRKVLRRIDQLPSEVVKPVI